MASQSQRNELSYKESAKVLRMSQKVFGQYASDYRLVTGLQSGSDGRRHTVTPFERWVIHRASVLVQQRVHLDRTLALRAAITEARITLAISEPVDLVAATTAALLATSQLESRLRAEPRRDAALIQADLEALRRTLLHLRQIGSEGGTTSETNRLMHTALYDMSRLTTHICRLSDLLGGFASVLADSDDASQLAADQRLEQLITAVQATPSRAADQIGLPHDSGALNTSLQGQDQTPIEIEAAHHLPTSESPADPVEFRSCQTANSDETTEDQSEVVDEIHSERTAGDTDDHMHEILQNPYTSATVISKESHPQISRHDLLDNRLSSRLIDSHTNRYLTPFLSIVYDLSLIEYCQSKYGSDGRSVAELVRNEFPEICLQIIELYDALPELDSPGRANRFHHFPTLHGIPQLLRLERTLSERQEALQRWYVWMHDQA